MMNNVSLVAHLSREGISVPRLSVAPVHALLPPQLIISCVACPKN